MKREYQVIFQKIEDGWIMATIPNLPGAVTQGKDVDKARANTMAPIALVLESYRADAAKDAAGNAVWESLTVDVPLA